MIFHELLITLQTNRLNMKKKLYILILLMVAFVLPSNAVLKEANLDTTLYMLRTELTNYHIDLEKQNKVAKAQQQQVLLTALQYRRDRMRNFLKCSTKVLQTSRQTEHIRKLWINIQNKRIEKSESRSDRYDFNYTDI